MKKNKLISICGLFLIVFLLLVFKDINAQTGTSAVNPDSSDAIAVRIVPNPSHVSVSHWYESQGFTGSPQALTVDGYDAIRDGRTVYVGAANITGKSIFTNIYLISYSQDPSVKTVDILGQIIKNWKFNTDLSLVEKTNPAPSCAISSIPCSSNADCTKDQTCATSGIASSSCQLVNSKNCLTDTECPTNFYCNSIKSKIIRDIKRIGETQELNSALLKYKETNGSYPKLPAGTYLSGYTVSAWPSWSESFLSGLGMTQSFVDPINRLGSCPGFDAKTCWNSVTKKFVYNPSATGLVLPAGSYGFVYNTDSAGSNYNLCSVMETREPTADLNFQFSPSVAASSNCVTAIGITTGGQPSNTPPRLVDSFLTGEANQEFNGYIKVVDDENNPLNWVLASGNNWLQANWTEAPSLKDTGNPNQKKVYSIKAGNPGTYPVSLVVTDGQGGTLSTTTNIIITNSKPGIEADNAEYTLDPLVPFNYSFYFSGNNLNDPKTAYTVSAASPFPSGLNLLKVFPEAYSAAGSNRFQVAYQGLIPTANKFFVDTDFFYRISIKDKYNSISTKDFKITLKVENPALNLNCFGEQRANYPYSCALGSITDGNHQLAYSASNLPAGLTLSTENGSAIISGKAALPGGSDTSVPYNFNVKVTNEYGASSTKPLSLRVNTFCGDGVKQSLKPNTEGRGGVYNDGYEDCDGGDGITANVPLSNINLQYACSTVSSDTPNPILNNSYCVYKSPLDGGGFCGDGFCDLSKEGACNCAKDCLSTQDCCGDGLITGKEVCDTALMPKACTSTFNVGLPAYCAGIPLTGTQTCKSDCSGWGSCSLPNPTISTTNSGDCSSLSPVATGTCCELLNCVNDKCGCCGRYDTGGNSGWEDLIAKATGQGYVYKTKMSPNNSACTVSDSDPTVCVCGTPGCSSSPICPKPSDPKNKTNDSCVIAQSNSNLNNWMVLTNHTTATYKCWK